MHFHQQIEYCASIRAARRCSIVCELKAKLIRVIYGLLLHKLNSSLSRPMQIMRQRREKTSRALHCAFSKMLDEKRKK